MGKGSRRAAVLAGCGPEKINSGGDREGVV